MTDPASTQAAVAPPVAAPPSSPVGTQRRSHWQRWGRWLTWGLLAGVLLLALTLWLAWRSTATLPWLLARVPGLQAQGVSGSLAGRDARIEQLTYDLPADGGRLQLQGLALEGVGVRVQPHEGAWAALRIDRLHVTALAFRPGPPAETPEPAAPPESLTSPVALRIGQLTVGRLDVQGAPAMQDLDASVAIADDAGERHRVALAALSLWPQHLADGDLATDETAQARQAAGRPDAAAPAGFDLGAAVGLSGSVNIGTAAPLALDAKLQARGTAGRAWLAAMQAKGPLTAPELTVDLEAKGDGKTDTQQVNASATLQPWASWPLQALRLSTQALNLRAFSPDWPETALTGQADVRSQGLDVPAEVDVQLRNARPGALNGGRLPLSAATVQVKAVPENPDRLTVRRFELRLADGQAQAGRVTGQGEWNAGQLKLDLQVADLEPARVHGSATPMRLAGPITVRASGLSGGQPGAAAAPWQVDWTADLDGHPLPRIGPDVALRTQGQARPGRVTLTTAELKAGDASAILRGDMALGDSAWQIDLDASLRRFDPRPWWRGARAAAQPRPRPAATGAAQARDAPAPTPGTSAPAATTGADTGTPNALAAALPPPPKGALQLNADLTVKVSGQGALARLGAEAPAQWIERVTTELRLNLQPSLVAGLPVQGTVTASGRGAATALQAELTAGGNRVAAQADAGAVLAPDKATRPVQAEWQAPDLSTLSAWREWVQRQWPVVADYWPRRGRTEGQVVWRAGRDAGPLATALQGGATSGAARIDDLVMAAGSLKAANARWQLASAADAELALNIAIDSWRPAGADAPVLEQLRADIQGTVGEHRISADIQSPLKPPAGAEALLGPAGTGSRARFAGVGQWQPVTGGSEWRLRDASLQAAARGVADDVPAWVAAPNLTATVKLHPKGAGLRGLTFGAGEARLARTTALRWQAIDWQPDDAIPGGRWSVDATLDRFEVPRLLARLQPDGGWGGDLTLGGRIEIRNGQQLDADILLERVAGDLTLTDELGQTQALGLTDLRLSATAHDGNWQLAQGLAGRSIGTMVGAQVVRTSPGARWPAPEDPLQGVLQARVGNLAAWATWVPPGWRLSGALDAQAQVSGRFGAPELRGQLNGSDLGLRNVLEGVALSDGVLALALEGEKVTVERFDFRAGKGRVTLDGGATLGEQPAARLTLKADQALVLGRIDRRIIASGQAELRLDAKALKLDGRFGVDEGLIDVSRSDAPSLDDDVVVIRKAEPQSGDAEAAAAPPSPAMQNAQVEVVIDLGDRLLLRGRGIETRLAGELTLKAPGGQPALYGKVRTIDGRYAAYGQKLDISRGVFTFSGPIANPTLEVLATRPNLDVSVGVAVGGTAQSPQVRLYSDPELSDYDKLSWLVLGRSPDGLGSADTALLQRAAVALLSGDDGPGPTDQLLGALGISDFSVRQGDGDTGDTIISLGRQLSRRWYVGYERSVNATTGTWQLVYRIAQRFTLRAQSGSADNALDLIWTWRW